MQLRLYPLGGSAILLRLCLLTFFKHCVNCDLMPEARFFWGDEGVDQKQTHLTQFEFMSCSFNNTDLRYFMDNDNDVLAK